MKKYLFKKAAGLLLAALVSAPSFGQQKNPKQIKKSVAVEVVSQGNISVRKYDNIVAGYFGSNEMVAGNSYKDKALNYIKLNWQKFGMEQTPEQTLKFLAEKSLAGTQVVRFRQYYAGLSVDQNEFTVSFNSEQKVVGFLNTSVPVKGLKTAVATLKKEAALQKVLTYLQKPERIRRSTNDLMVHLINFKPYLCYKIDILADNPVGEWQAYVDAASGEILEVQNIANDVNGTGSVYDTDPVTSAQTSYGTGNFVDNNNADNPDLNAQQFTVTLPNITFGGGLYKLAGPLAVIVDHESPFLGLFTQATNYFGYNRTNNAFEAVMCYYHINKSMDYINNTLGVAVMPQQYAGGVQFDPSGLNNGANAHYTSGDGRIAFGSAANAVDAAEDAGVILHELGHGIHDWVMAGTGVSQNQGLSEGCGDYWAKSYERSLGYWNPGEWGYDHVFFWGVEPLFAGRNCNTFFLPYPTSFPGQVHTDGQMWCSTLMKIWNDIGKTKTDKMFLVGLGMTNTTTTQAGAANACYQAAVNLGYTNAELCIIWHHFNASYGTYFTATQPSSGADIFIQDTPNDFGVEANPDNGPMWTSNDIWVRHTNDGGLVHENPEYTTINPNYIYVRIHGRGCTTITNAQLHVYFSKASTGLQWSSNWINYTITQFGLPVLAGNEITTTPVNIPALAPGDEVIIGIPWFPPNPATFESEIHHFCLVARIVSASDPMFVVEGTDINANTKNNNNIAWKNVSVFNNDPNDLVGPGVFIRNNGKLATTNEIKFANATGAWNPLFYKNGDLFITLNAALFDAWVRGGRIGASFKQVDDKGRMQVVDDKFYLGGIALQPGIQYLANVYYKPGANAKNCAFDLMQTDVSSPRRKILVGGERFEYKPNTKLAEINNGDGTQLDIIAGGNGNSSSNAIATWQNTKGLYPNPASDFVNVSIPYGSDNGTVDVFNSLGIKMMTVNIPVHSTTVKMSISSFKTGAYFIQVKNKDGVTVSRGKLEKL